jgi:hypothetical protein
MITTLNKVKEYLNIATADVANDAILNNAIATATTFIDSYCRQNIVQTTNVRFFLGEPNFTTPNTLIFRNYPVNSISLIREKDLTPDATFSNLSTNDFYLFNTNKVSYLQKLNGAFNYRKIYEITFVSGYATVPKDIEQVAIEIVAIQFNESSKGKGNLAILDVARNLGGVNETQKSSKEYLNKRWKQVLDFYRMPLI